MLRLICCSCCQCCCGSYCSIVKVKSTLGLGLSLEFDNMSTSYKNYIIKYKKTQIQIQKEKTILEMTSNKTYHSQTTANHHRFIKVWTSIADLPTSNFCVQTFFLEKVWLRNTLPTYDLDICPNFRSFFSDLSPKGILT